MWSIISPLGNEVPLTGLSVAVRQSPGAGMPPIEHSTTERALDAGTLYQLSLVRARRIMLRLVSRQRQATLGATRMALIHALNPDLVGTQSPAYLTYTGVSKTLRLPVVYDGGLEDGDNETIELRFLAHDPVWTTTTQTSRTLAAQATLAPADYLVQRLPTGVWTNFPSPGGAIHALLVAADGTRTIGGACTGNVCRWDAASQQWVALAGLNGTVTCLAESPDGILYAGGAFTAPGPRIARWNGANWVAMGDPELLPEAIVVGSDGIVSIGGSDLSGSGHTVKRWDGGTAWSTLGSSPGGTVYTLLMDGSGGLLAGGDFPGGVRRWTGDVWATLGSGLARSTGGNPLVRALVRAPDGTIYAGGDFNRADGSFAANIARWNGVTWLPLSSGVGAPINALTVRQDDGMLFAVGQFTVAGGLSIPDTMAQWNGYAWFPLDIDIQLAPDTAITTVAAPPDGSLLVGFGTPASATSAAVTTITNTGSAATYPILTVQGPGRVYQLVNWTAGEAIYFNLALLAGEELTIDLRLGRKTIMSSFRGNLLGVLVPGSTLTTWRLLPGDNLVSLFVDQASASATLTWSERHWSIDGAD